MTEHLHIHSKWLFFKNLIWHYRHCHSYIIAIQKSWKIDRWRKDYDERSEPHPQREPFRPSEPCNESEPSAASEPSPLREPSPESEP